MKTLRNIFAVVALVAGLATLSQATTTSTSTSTTLDADNATLTYAVTNVTLDGFPGVSPSEVFTCDSGALTSVCLVHGLKFTFAGAASAKTKVTFAASTLGGSSCTPLLGSNDTATVSVTSSLTSCTYLLDWNVIAYTPTTCKGPYAGIAFRLRAHIVSSTACA